MKRIVVVLCLLWLASLGYSQSGSEPGVQLEQRVSRLEQAMQHTENTGIPLFLFGAFCALWAQNTRRNSWFWFFSGVLFSVITVLVLLNKNAEDRKKPKVYPTPLTDRFGSEGKNA